MKVININKETFFEDEECFSLSELQINDFELYGRKYKTVLCSADCANDLMEMFPGLSVIGENAEGVHLTQKDNNGVPVNPVDYLKEVYGLEPNDLSLPFGFTVDQVEHFASKYNLTRKENMSLQKAITVLKTIKK